MESTMERSTAKRTQGGHAHQKVSVATRAASRLLSSHKGRNRTQRSSSPFCKNILLVYNANAAVTLCTNNMNAQLDILRTTPVRTSQETHHVSATEPNRLMLCGETVAVWCENRTEHKDTLWAVRTSQETHHVSTTEPNRLMLRGETVAGWCENRTEHTDTLWAVRTSQETHHVPLQSPSG
jgi:hypothetical protein